MKRNIQNKKTKYLKYLFGVAVIIWMCVIFWFSAQPAVKSTQMSLTFGRKICSIFVPGYSKLSEKKQYTMAENIEFPVRKSAHASEYALLAMLCCGLFMIENKNKKSSKYFVFSWMIAVLYACTDEYHQLFVPGRSGQLRDVMIDAVGAAVGVLFIKFVIYRFRILRKK